MADKSIEILKDALELVSRYRNETFKAIIQREIAQGKPIAVRPGRPPRYIIHYIGRLATYSPELYKLYLSSMNMPEANFLEKVDTFLVGAYKRPTEISKVKRIVEMLEAPPPTPPPPDRPYPQPQIRVPFVRQSSGPITEADKKQLQREIKKQDRRDTAYSLADKIRKYGQEFADQQKRAELIKAGIFSQEEADFILEAGLVKGAVGGKARGFKNLEEWKKEVYKTAIRIVRSQEKRRKDALSKISIGAKKLLANRIASTFLSGAILSILGYVAAGPFGALLGGLPIAVRMGAGNQAGNIAGNLLNIRSSGIKRAVAGRVGRAVAVRGMAFLIATPWGWAIIGFTILLLLFFFLPLLTTSSFFSPGAKKISSSLFVPGNSPRGVTTSCPDTSANTDALTCRYLNPSINIFDTDILESDVQSYIAQYSPIFINAQKGDEVEFRKRVYYIIEGSKKAGLNPAIFLGYWKSESYFSTVGTRDMGCVGDDFYEQVDCALGTNSFSDPLKNPVANCAKSRDSASLACSALKSIRAKQHDLLHPISYPIATIDDLAEAYGPYEDRVGGNPTNCTHTYNILIEVTKELNMCRLPIASPPPDGDYQKWMADSFKIDLDSSFGEERIKWAYEVLYESTHSAPFFRSLVYANGPTKIVPGGIVSERKPGQINLSPGAIASERFFKITLIHELGHTIKGGRTENAEEIGEAISADGGFLTAYAQGSTATANIACIGADSGEEEVQADEDFAESVTYYINNNMPELDMDKAHRCPPRTTPEGDILNPFKIIDSNPLKPKYLAHCQLMREVLGGENCPLSFKF